MNTIFKIMLYKLGLLDRPQLNVFLREKRNGYINRKRRDLYANFDVVACWREAKGEYEQDAPPFNHKSWTL